MLLLVNPLLFGKTAQAEQAGRPADQYVELERLLNRLSPQLDGIPFDIQRAVLLNLDYNPGVLTSEGVDYIHNRIENIIMQHRPVRMLNLPEVTVSNELTIEGTDSTLLISNIREHSHAGSSNMLLSLAQTYAVDAFIHGSVSYSANSGYVLSLRMVRPASRDIIWSTSLLSRDIEVKPERGGSMTLLNFGAGLQTVESYAIGGLTYPGDILFLNYSGILTLRQPVFQNNSAFLGVTLGAHYNTLMSLDDDDNFESFTVAYGQIGFAFFKTLAGRAEVPDDHWIDLFVGGNMYLPLEKNNLFALVQGINLNITPNIGLTLSAEYLLSARRTILHAEHNNSLNLSNLNYGLKLLFRL